MAIWVSLCLFVSDIPIRLFAEDGRPNDQRLSRYCCVFRYVADAVSHCEWSVLCSILDGEMEKRCMKMKVES